MSKMGLTVAKIITRGKAFFPPYAAQNGLESARGLIWSLLNVVNFGAISTADADGACASQSVSSGVPALINGALAAGGVATFATPRNVVAAWTATAIITVTGTDQYGVPIVESSGSGTSFTGKKAFKTITRVTFNANVTGATVGEGVLIGLPFRIDGIHQIIQVGEGGAMTLVTADDTDPATATTGDVRGTLSWGSAPNGTREYAVWVSVEDTDTVEAVFGVPQYGG